MDKQSDNFVPTLAGASASLANGSAMQQVKTSYTTAVAVQKPRILAEVEQRLLQEADQAGEDFYYGWGAGKDRVEGPSVGLALAAARCYGNCAVEMAPVQDTFDAWIFTASFIDLETGFTLSRQLRQSKRWIVYGKHDEARKEDIRFQIGQSKAIRNVVTNSVPEWLINKAMDRAKGGVRDMIQRTVDQHGIEAVIERAVEKLSALGIDEARVLAKFGRPTTRGLTVEDLVLIRGDLSAIGAGQDTVDNLYPQPVVNSAVEGGVTADDLLTPKAAQSSRTKKRAGKGKSADAGNDPPKDKPEESPPGAEHSDAYYDLTARIRGCQSDGAVLSAKQQLIADKGKLTEPEYMELTLMIEDATAEWK